MDESGRWGDLYALRKTFGTALVLNGEPPRVVMEAPSGPRNSPDGSAND
jgi:hypothetical protein